MRRILAAVAVLPIAVGLVFSGVSAVRGSAPVNTAHSAAHDYDNAEQVNQVDAHDYD